MYPKPPLNYEEQLEKLKKRGCIINDDKKCISILESVNYYRLSAYFLPFKLNDGNYKEGLSFERVFSIYEFDRKLHGILFNALEETEIFLRSKIAYFHAHKYGALGYMEKSNFYKKSDDKNHKKKKKKFHKNFIENFKREIEKNKNILFVKHHIKNYGGEFPIWAASEMFTFGMLSKFFANMKLQDQKSLSSDIYKTKPKYVGSWLRCCTDLRNICAHYGRLYFRIFSAAPSGIDNLEEKSKRKLWGAILSLKKLYPFKDKWNNETLKKLISLVDEHKSNIDLEHVGFPNNWDKELENDKYEFLKMVLRNLFKKKI